MDLKAELEKLYHAGKNSLKRIILNPKRGNNNLIIQSSNVGPDREKEEAHNRERFANHFKYADQYTGNTRTFDEEGRYNCGRCNQANQDRCLLIKKSLTIDLEAGSCAHWENQCAGDSEMELHEMSPEVANYGAAANEIGFGCFRCPFASKAIEADSRGRSLYCGKGDFRVYPEACCALNGAKLKDDYDEKVNRFKRIMTGIKPAVPYKEEEY